MSSEGRRRFYMNHIDLPRHSPPLPCALHWRANAGSRTSVCRRHCPCIPLAGSSLVPTVSRGALTTRTSSFRNLAGKSTARYGNSKSPCVRQKEHVPITNTSMALHSAQRSNAWDATLRSPRDTNQTGAAPPTCNPRTYAAHSRGQLSVETQRSVISGINCIYPQTSPSCSAPKKWASTWPCVSVLNRRF